MSDTIDSAQYEAVLGMVRQLDHTMSMNEDLIRRVQQEQERVASSGAANSANSKEMAKEVANLRDQVSFLVREKHHLVEELRRVTSIVDRSNLSSSPEEAMRTSVADEISRLTSRISDLERERDTYKAALRTFESGGKKDAQRIIESLIETVYEKEALLENQRRHVEELQSQVDDLVKIQSF